MFSVQPVAFDRILEYEQVPIRFEVRQVLEVGSRADGFVSATRPASTVYTKDYDAFPDERPSQWPRRFDVSNWQLFLAHHDGRVVGGAAVAWATKGVDLLESRLDLAVLWDIRVSPEMRRAGIGSTLFAAAERWAAAQGCVRLKVETQNTNVPACRFYARHGCRLGAVNRSVYPTLPDEIQLLWYKELSAHHAPPAR